MPCDGGSGASGSGASGSSGAGNSSGASSSGSGSSSMTGRTIDCCYALGGARAMREAMNQGAQIMVHNYDPNAPSWCDIFDVHVDGPNGAWLPFEDMTSSPSASSISSSSSDGPSPALLAMATARTLQARLDAAKAAMKASRNDTIDVRLLMTDSMPEQKHSAPLKALLATADAAREAGGTDADGSSSFRWPRFRTDAEVQQQEKERQQLLQSDLALPVRSLQQQPRQRRAALRAFTALLRCYQRDICEEDYGLIEKHWQVLHHMDSAGLTGGSYLLRLATLWLMMENPKTRRQAQTMLVVTGEEYVLAHHWVQSLLMVTPYSLYFAAFYASSSPGGGPHGALVRAALAATRQLDPAAWVPRLLAGLELADATSSPSVVLGSKQEAVAVCRLLGPKWPLLNGGAFSMAYQRLLAERGVHIPPCDIHTTFRSETITFNTYGNYTGPGLDKLRKLSSNKDLAAPENMRTQDINRLLTADCHLLSALASATHNLPPVTSHFQHWQASTHVRAVLVLDDGCSSSEMERVQSVLYTWAEKRWDQAVDMFICLKQRMAKSDRSRREVDRLGAWLYSLRHDRIRWLWQCGQIAHAIVETNRTVAAGEVKHAALHRLHAYAPLVAFLEQEAMEQADPMFGRVAHAAASSTSCQQRAQCASSSAGGSSQGNGSALGTCSNAGMGSAAGTSGSHEQRCTAETRQQEGVDVSTTSTSKAEPKVSSQPRCCKQCGEAAVNVKRCGGCGKVRYCSTKCQALHWKQGHKAACSRRLLPTTADASTKQQDNAG